MNDSGEQGHEVGHTLSRHRLNLDPDAFVAHEGAVYRITTILDFDTVVAVSVETGVSKALRVRELKPVETGSVPVSDAVRLDMDEIADRDWKVAEKRYAAIKPLLTGGVPSRSEVEERAQAAGVSLTTMYRWLSRYRNMESLSALVPGRRGWKPGKRRISVQAEAVVREVIEDTYLTTQRSSPQKVVTEVKRRCDARGLDAPHPNTIRARVSRISGRVRLKRRGYHERAKNEFDAAAGMFPPTTYPLEVVQIDHTPADIILVDDIYRLPIGRPWITLAIDAYSRMIVGYYLSFDPPSGVSVAMCLAQATLPKEEWLALHNVEASWDVWGFMDKVHVDNGADFRAGTLQDSCLIHGINLEYRPPGLPGYGGYIERCLGTLLTEIHDLPGTTFSSIKEREGYDSEKHATMTKSEFETWLVTLICKVYHQRLHSALGTSPQRKWEIGMFGNAEVSGHGVPPRPSDRLSVLLDFLPGFRRTIQPYGVAIEGPRYYSEVLRGWINAKDPMDEKSKRRFIFRRDPRDISCLWFFDPQDKQYYRVPFADQSLPSMSVWEYRQARARAKAEGMKAIDERLILRALTELREQVETSKKRSKKARRASQQRVEHEKGVTPADPLARTPINKATPRSAPLAGLLDEDVAPPEEID